MKPFRRSQLVALGLFGLIGMAVYVPRLGVERIYVVVPVRNPGSPVVSMGRTNDLREIREESAGYSWVWSAPDEGTWFGAEREYRINWQRLALQAAIWSLLVFAATIWQAPPKPAGETGSMTCPVPDSNHSPD